MSGHSRWSQVKHKKAASDAKRGQLFSKLVREITMAVRSGGPDPDANPRLRSALERARSLGLPKENSERAILRASGGEGGASLQEFLYEATAPNGVQILVEGITDNKNRTLAEIRQTLAGHGAKLAPPNSLLWNFEKVWTGGERSYRVKTPLEIPAEKLEKLTPLFDELSGQVDVQEVYTNLKEH